MNAGVRILGGVLQGHTGKLSHMRVMTTLMVVIILGTWSSVSISKSELQPLHEELAWVLAAALGAAVGHRVAETRPKNSAGSATDAPTGSG